MMRTPARQDRPVRTGSRSRWVRLRARVRDRPVLGPLYRAGVGVVGTGIVVAGLLLVPLPGPGWLIVFAGLGVLATEFTWAARLLALARRLWGRWTRWVLRRSPAMRGLLGLAGCLAVAGVVAAYLRWQGVPAWLPFS